MRANVEIEPGFDASALHGYFMVDMPLKDVLAELIDNAFDANADKVRVEITRSGITVMDNGEGIMDMSTMFRVGKSGRHSSFTSIGQFGVGAKNALLAIGSITDICSSHEGMFYEAQADWKHMATNGFSPISQKVTDDKSKLRKANSLAMSWWTTSVSVRRPHPEKGRIIGSAPALAKAMAIRYRPALLHGKEIVLFLNGVLFDLKNHETCKPKLTDEITREISINDKSFRLTAGIAIDQVPGLTGCALISYGNRMIETPQMIYNHTLDRKFFLSIDLSNDWRRSLTTHKNKVTSDRELLMETVWGAIEEVANKLREQKKEIKMEILLEGIGKEIEKVLQRLNEAGQEDTEEGGSDEERDPGKGRGHGGGSRTGPTKPSKATDGKKKVNRKPKASPKTIEFIVVRDATLLGLTDVICSVSDDSAIAEIKVFINDKNKLISEMADNESRSLQLIISTALSQYFLTDEGTKRAHKLFGRFVPDDDLPQAQQHGILSKELMQRLSKPKPIPDKDMDF